MGQESASGLKYESLLLTCLLSLYFPEKEALMWSGYNAVAMVFVFSRKKTIKCGCGCGF